VAVSPIVLTASKSARIHAGPTVTAGPSVRRRISPEAGHALEILGHAIDYLTDEYIHRGGQFRAGDTELIAIDLLMKANRTVYFECPVIPGFRERCLRFFGIGGR
jgi:hypothetical protein